jgi:signal transduction histidine kinase
VASQWRIRHKLMLGLGLVVAIMALLLGGTLRGLWSYYVTVNSIRSKLAELKAAQDLREAVGNLGRPERRPQPPESKADGTDELTAFKNLLRGQIPAARQKLLEYDRRLQETLSHTHDPINGDHQKDLIQKDLIQSLSNHLDKLEEMLHQSEGAKMKFNMPSEREERVERDKLERKGDDLKRDASDLRNNIYDALDRHISETRGHYQDSFWIIVPASVVGLLLVTGLLRSFYAWVLDPIRDLEAGVNRVAKGDFGHRIEVHSGDEMEDLGAAFNDMTRRLQDLYGDLARQVNERSRQLIRSERLASVGFLAAGVAHEINNPLASIAFCGEALEVRLAELLHKLRAAGWVTADQDVYTKYLKMIQEEAFRCKNITERLLAFSRTGERRREETDLRALVQSVLDVAQHLQNHKGKQITFAVAAERGQDGRVTAWVNAEEIKQVVLNLVVNALDSMDDGGRLTVRLAPRGDMAELQFTDTGCGMTQEVLENIFEPFFTRSRTGKGTGLGLTISHRIITQHGGEIEASSPGPNRGSTFTVRLPLRPHDEPAALPAPAADAAQETPNRPAPEGRRAAA